MFNFYLQESIASSLLPTILNILGTLLAALIAAGVAVYVSNKNNEHNRKIEEERRTKDSEVEFTQKFIVLEDFVLDYFGHGKDSIRLSTTGFNTPKYIDENGYLKFDTSCVVPKEKLGKEILKQTESFDKIYLDTRKSSIILKDIVTDEEYKLVSQTLKDVKSTFDDIRSDAHKLSTKKSENKNFDEVYIHINTHKRLEHIKENFNNNTKCLYCLGYKYYMTNLCEFYIAKEKIKKISSIEKYM